MRQLFHPVLFSCLLFSACLYAGPNSTALMAVDFVPETPAADTLDTFTTATTITLAVRVGNAVNLDAYQFDLRYDTTVLKFKSAMEDNPFASLDNVLKVNGGTTVGFICKPRTGVSGVLNIANTLVGDDSAHAPEGGGILAVLMFTVLNQQTCTLFIEKGFAVNYEQVRDSVKTYSDGVIKAASTAVSPVAIPSAPRRTDALNTDSEIRNCFTVDIMGRCFSSPVFSNRLLLIKGKKRVLMSRHDSVRY